MKMSNNKGPATSLGDQIKHYRKQAGLSQQELAETIGYKSGTAISLIESGDRGIDVKDLSSFAEALGISVPILLGEETAPDLTTALRADDSLTPKDKKEILNFYNYVKKGRK